MIFLAGEQEVVTSLSEDDTVTSLETRSSKRARGKPLGLRGKRAREREREREAPI